MKVRYNGDSDALGLINGNVYDVLAIECGHKWYRLIDETGEDYIYPVSNFDIVDKNPAPPEYETSYYEGRINLLKELENLSEKQLFFLLKTFKITKDELYHMSNEELDELYDNLSDLTEETDTENGRIADSICDVFARATDKAYEEALETFSHQNQK